VIIFVLVIARLMRPQTGERGGDRRRFQACGRNSVEIHGVGHEAPVSRAVFVGGSAKGKNLQGLLSGMVGEAVVALPS